MPGIVRQGDMTTGHGSFPPTIFIQGSPDTFVNGLPVVRQGDKALIHCDPTSCHVGDALAGGGGVFVNGLPVQKVGDPLSCGDSSAMGSVDTMAG